MRGCIVCGGYNPICPACRPLEFAPIVNNFPGGATFKGAGNSHFTFSEDKFHETTEIPGLGQGRKISIRTDFDQ